MKLPKMHCRWDSLPRSVAISTAILALLLWCHICEASTISILTPAQDGPTSRPVVAGLTCASRNPESGYCSWNNSIASYTNHTLQRRGVNKERWTQVSCKTEDKIPWEGCTSRSKFNVDHICYIDSKSSKRYYYRVMSTSALGETKYTNLMSPSGSREEFSIWVHSYPCPPDNSEVHTNSSSSVTISWDPPAEYPPNYCTYLQYRIRYKYHSDAEFTEPSVTYEDPNTNCASLQTTVDKLQPPYANVYIQISTQDRLIGPDSPWSEWSQMLHTRLFEEAPTGVPGNFNFKIDKNGESNKLIDVLLSWTPIPENEQNGRIIGYDIGVQGQSPKNVTDYHHIYSADENATQYAIPGLNRTYRYIIDILAYNKAGKSPKSDTVLTVEPSEITDTENNSQLVIAVSVSIAVSFVIAALCILMYCVWTKTIASQVFEVKIPNIVLKNNYNANLGKGFFRTQEPEHFDDINTAVAGSYVDVRDEATVPCLTVNIYPNYMEGHDYVKVSGNQSPSAESSGHGTLCSVGSQDLSGQGITDDKISYHMMSPTGLSPVVKNFSDIFCDPFDNDDAMGCGKTRSPDSPVVIEDAITIDKPASSDVICYLTMPPSQVSSDHDEDVPDAQEEDPIKVDSKNITVAYVSSSCTPPPPRQNESHIGANGLTRFNDHPTDYVTSGMIGHEKFVEERQTSDPYVMHSSLPGTPTLGTRSARGGDNSKDTFKQPQSALEDFSRSGDKVGDKEATEDIAPYVLHNAIPMTGCYKKPDREDFSRNGDRVGDKKATVSEDISPYVLHSAIPMTLVSNTGCTTMDRDVVPKPTEEKDDAKKQSLPSNQGYLTMSKVNDTNCSVKPIDHNGYVMRQQLQNTMTSIQQVCTSFDTQEKTV